MALLSSAIAFSWSKWNSEMETSDKVLFQGSEALEDEPLLEVRPARSQYNENRFYPEILCCPVGSEYDL